MNSYYRTMGFVFGKEDSLEADRIFSVFTKDLGFIKATAKSIRKIKSKLKSSIDIFYLSEIDFVQGKSKKTLTDATSLKKFKDIFENPEKLEIAYVASKLLDSFLKGEERDEQIFDLIVDFFHKLNDCQLPITGYWLLSNYFFWNFMALLGYEPELYQCASCHQKLIPENIYFSSSAGGVICHRCSASFKDKITASQDIVKILRLITNKDWETLKRLKVDNNIIRSLSKYLNNYYLYFLPKHEEKNKI